MKCPKYIEDALNKRAKAAIQFNKYDSLVSRWINKNNIYVESENTFGGVDAIMHPEESKKVILEAIKKAWYVLVLK